MTSTLTGQLLLGTDKRNPLFTVYEAEETEPEEFHVYYGLELLEVVSAERSEPSFKMLVGRLANAGVSRRVLQQTFAVDRKTIQRWGRALRSHNAQELVTFLPKLGATDVEIEKVLSAINCTGPNSEISRLHFRDPVSRFVGCALATADYLAQLSDPQYPDKLGHLFREFRESDDFTHVPAERRVFRSENDLICRTPGFWVNFVKPKLNSDLQAVYRYLASPFPAGRNAYLEAVDANLATIDRMITGINSGVR